MFDDYDRFLKQFLGIFMDILMFDSCYWDFWALLRIYIIVYVCHIYSYVVRGTLLECMLCTVLNIGMDV